MFGRRRQRHQRQLARDVEHYLAEETADHLARGLTLEDARAAARRKLGNVTLRQEDLYLMNTMQPLDRVWQDVKYGLRQLRQQPGFTLAAVLSLALGIGANTAIFTLVDQVLLRLLPVERPEELVQLRVDGGRFGGQSGDGVHTFPYPTFVALRDRNTVFTGLTGQRVQGASMMAGDRSELVSVGMVAGNFFEVFGVRPKLGRLLTPADDQKLNGHPVAVLQYDFWRNRFNANPGIVGQTIRLTGTPFTIIGVAGPGFLGTDPAFANHVWVPIMMKPSITPTDPRLDDERQSWFYPFARLKPGVTLEKAQAELRVLYRQRQQEELKDELFSRFPQLRDRFLRQTFLLEPAAAGASSLRSGAERPLILLQLLVGAVLLIAAANVAGLLLARGAARQRELAIRGAIGASRGRIASQLFAESLLLALAGGVTGAAFGFVLTRALLSLMPYDPTNFTLTATPNLRVLGFTALLAGVTAVLFGLLPAWQNSRVAPASTMREEAGSLTGTSASLRWRKLFVGLQVALSTLLLLAAGLFVRTLGNLRQVDLGVKAENVIAFGVTPAAPVDNARKQAVYRQFAEGLAAVPGTKAVGLALARLFTGGRSDGSITLAGVPENKEPNSFFNWVTPGYFEALGIQVKAGRDFDWRDWNAGKKLALVNERFVKEYFTSGLAVGERLGRGMRVPLDYEIIGVASNARYHDVRGEVPVQSFFNMDSQVERSSGVTAYVRASGDPVKHMAAIQTAVRQIDRNLVISNLRTLEEQIDSRLAAERLLSYLSAAFAVLATLLALVGLYGVLAFTVARRTREIGIRLALGAKAMGVVRLVAADMLLVAAVAVCAGLCVGYLAGRYVESLLFGLKAHDPWVFAGAALVLTLAALAATLWPSWRASRIDPMRALRWE